MSSGLADLFANNPLMERATKSLSVIRNLRTMPPSGWVVVAFVTLVYGVLVVAAIKSADVIDGGLFIYLMLTVEILIPATVLHSALAGEREKRSLDLLLAAPVTGAQIVTAKLVKAVVPIVTVLLVCVVPTLALSMVQAHGTSTWIHPVSVINAAMCSLVAFSAAVMVTGATMYVSAKTKTTASSLTAVVGILFLWFVVFPIMFAMVSEISSDFSQALMTLHPYQAVTKLLYETEASPIRWCLLNSLIHLSVGAVGIVLTAKALERERKTGSQNNA